MNHSNTNMTNAAASPATAPVCSQDRVNGIDHPATHGGHGGASGCPEDAAQDHGQPRDASGEEMLVSSLTRREALVHYERPIQESLDREDESAAALLVIHDQHLYKLTHN